MTQPQQRIEDLWKSKQTSIPAGQPFGFLCWWTVSSGIYPLSGLLTSLASTVNDQVQMELVDRMLKGASPGIAWTKATQLGALGHSSFSPLPHTTARYLTRDVGRETRAIVREVIDKGEQLVVSQQLALITREDAQVTTELDLSAIADNRQAAELLALISEMQAEMDRRIGSVDDTVIRDILYAWLGTLNKLNLRERGGVYFIPSPPPGESALHKQQMILDMRQWVVQANLGSFSVVRLYNDEATTISEIQESAVSEVLRELEEVDKKLAEYQQNAKMNAGSRMYSASTQVEKVKQVGLKVLALQESLGDIAGRIEATYRVIEGRAKRLHAENQALVEQGDGLILPDGNRTQTSKPSKPSSSKKSGVSTGKQKEKL